jgi:hypothetical protein
MVAVADITARDWSPALSRYGQVVTNVQDISQCLRIIFSTPIGSVPLRRDFGSRLHSNIDKPFAEAEVNIPIDILESVRWEPRVIIDAVRVLPQSGIAEMTVEIDWRVRNAASSDSQTLSLSTADLVPTAGSIITAAIAEAAVNEPIPTSDYLTMYEVAKLD